MFLKLVLNEKKNIKFFVALSFGPINRHYIPQNKGILAPKRGFSEAKSPFLFQNAFLGKVWSNYENICGT